MSSERKRQKDREVLGLVHRFVRATTPLKIRLLGIRYLPLDDNYLVASRGESHYPVLVSSLEGVQAQCEHYAESLGVFGALKARLTVSERTWLIARMQMMTNPPTYVSDPAFLAGLSREDKRRSLAQPHRYEEPLSPVEAYRRARWALTQLLLPFSEWTTHEQYDQRARLGLGLLSGRPGPSDEEVLQFAVRAGLRALAPALFPHLELRQKQNAFSVSISTSQEQRAHQELEEAYTAAEDVVRQLKPDLKMWDAVRQLKAETAQERARLALDQLPAAIEAMRSVFADDDDTAAGHARRSLENYHVSALIEDGAPLSREFLAQSQAIYAASSARRRALREAGTSVPVGSERVAPKPTPEQEGARSSAARRVNPNKAVVSGHGLREARESDGTFRCKCGQVLASAPESRAVARMHMREHRAHLAGENS